MSLVEALLYEPPRGGPMAFKVPEELFPLPGFSPSEDEKDAIRKKITKIRWIDPPMPIIILNPNMSDLLPIRRWPEENFVKLGNILLEKYPRAAIIITGGPEEEKRAASVASGINGAISLAGKTSLRELLTLYCIADILVTNDSGPAHFAALTPIKSVVLFGPETPLLYGDDGENSEAVTAGYICSPCISVYNHRKSPCQSGECLKSIKPEDICDKVRSLLWEVSSA